MCTWKHICDMTNLNLNELVKLAKENNTLRIEKIGESYYFLNKENVLSFVIMLKLLS